MDFNNQAEALAWYTENRARVRLIETAVETRWDPVTGMMPDKTVIVVAYEPRQPVVPPDIERLRVRFSEVHAAIAERDAERWHSATAPYFREAVSLKMFIRDHGLSKPSTAMAQDWHPWIVDICTCSTVRGPPSKPPHEALRCVLVGEQNNGARHARFSEVWERIDGEWYWGGMGDATGC